VKGKKLPGRMGGYRVTVKNLMIARIQRNKNIVMIEGAIPGSRNSTVILRKRNLGGAKS
jgi:large subunit ribosomal protein L3